jgi:hypothetical protein
LSARLDVERKVAASQDYFFLGAVFRQFEISLINPNVLGVFERLVTDFCHFVLFYVVINWCKCMYLFLYLQGFFSPPSLHRQRDKEEKSNA